MVDFCSVLTLFVINLYMLQRIWFDFFNVVIGKHSVKYNGREVNNLNELEYINGEVWANVWQVCPCIINCKIVFHAIWGFFFFFSCGPWFAYLSGIGLGIPWWDIWSLFGKLAAEHEICKPPTYGKIYLLKKYLFLHGMSGEFLYMVLCLGFLLIQQ